MGVRIIIREEIAKLFSETIDVIETMIPIEILDYINELHSEGYEEKEYEDWEWINSFDEYKLEEIRLSDLKISALYLPNIQK